jgi:hypothetical protein
MTIDIDQYVTAAEAARILGTTRRMVTYYINETRELYAHKIGPRICLIRRDAVERLKARRLARI